MSHFERTRCFLTLTILLEVFYRTELRRDLQVFKVIEMILRLESQPHDSTVWETDRTGLKLGHRGLEHKLFVFRRLIVSLLEDNKLATSWCVIEHLEVKPCQSGKAFLQFVFFLERKRIQCHLRRIDCGNGLSGAVEVQRPKLEHLGEGREHNMSNNRVKNCRFKLRYTYIIPCFMRIDKFCTKEKIG